MRTPAKILHLAVLGLVCVAAWRLGAAPGPTGNDGILQQELKQQQIRVTTQRVADQLSGIIAEFDRNGIAGEDVHVLRSIRGVLGKLSEKDMDLVIKYLQNARGAADVNASNRQATDAYAGQQTIIVQLRQLELEYRRQQELYRLSLLMKELATRQSGNMWLGVGLAKATEGRSSYNSFDESQRINLQLQQSQQAPIKEEVSHVLAAIEKLSKESTDGPTAERPKAALQQAREGGLLTALESANDELGKEKLKLLSAIGNEKKARDQMREIARLLTLSSDAAQALRQAIHELDHAMDEQKKVKAETQKAETKREAEERAINQAEVVDMTDLIRQDVDSLAPIAAEHLKTAIDKQQEARSALSAGEEAAKRRDKAAPRQAEALTQMQEARLALQEQLAKVEENAKKPEETLASLKQLQDEVRELIKKEEKLKEETASADKKELSAKAPAQGELKDKAQELQAKTATQAPPAAQSLGEAASEMQKAQNSLAQQQNNAPAQQAAIDALQKADQQLGQEIAKLEQAEKDLAALEELLKKLMAIIEAEQKVQLVTAKQAVQPQPEPETTQQLSAQQGSLAQETGALQKEATSPAPTAAKHLGDAKENMDQAKSELDKPAPQPAQTEETEALGDLYAAKKELEARISELREQLGLPPSDNEQSLADAMDAIQEAQRQVAEAQSQLQQSPPGLMEALQKEQQEIADSLKEMKQDSPEAKPLAKAEKSALEAAQRLGQSNLREALPSMNAALEAMQQQLSKPDANQAKEGLPQTSEKQEKLVKIAKAYLQAQESAPSSAMKAAAQALDKANSAISPLTAGEAGPLPSAAQSALQSAQGAMTRGSAQASAGQNPPAQQSAAQAAESLAQAQAALALAQAGLSSDAAMAQGQGQGQGEGQGQGQGKGKGKGQGQGLGQGQGQGRGTPPPQGSGNQGNWAGAGGANGPRNGTTGLSSFTALPKRDRAAIQQSQAEKYPQEYGPLVEQYLKNLSDQSGEK